MKLVPQGPPGRITRKARDFGADIVQLRAQGYTLDAIRQALNAAGVHVSISTVRREALRGAAEVPAASATITKAKALTSPMSAHDQSAGVVPAELVSTLAPSDWHNGKDVAHAYTRNMITNPFVRAKEKR